MTPEELAWLLTPPGLGAAELATSLLAAGTDELRVIEQLRKTDEPANARAAFALALGRRTAATKFPDGDRLFCDRAAAEQASSEIVAAHSAERFAGARLIADLGCGMGGDTLALARQAPVIAIDFDAGRGAMTSMNADVRGLGERVEVRTGELEAFVPEDRATLAWLDPGRRDGNG